MPKRVRLSRAKGWRLPPGTVVVSRPSRWGNPYPVGEYERAESMRRYEEDLLTGRLPVDVDEVRKELRGKDLACWCRLDQQCHADILMRIANG